MKIETGKTYLTRNGRKARVICTDRHSHLYPVVALVPLTNDTEEAVGYTLRGRYDVKHLSGYDLVSEYREPLTMWAAVDISDVSCMVGFNSEGKARKYAAENKGFRVAKFIEVIK